MSEPEDLLFAPTHEWVRVEAEQVTVGITKHAEEELGDVALLILPEVGRILQQGERFGEIESIKAVSDIYAPVSGEVIAANDNLNDAPENVNHDPYGSGWMIKIAMSNPRELDTLLTASAYESLINS